MACLNLECSLCNNILYRCHNISCPSNPQIFCILLWGRQRGGQHYFCWRILHQSHPHQGWMRLGGTHSSTVPGCVASCNIPLVRAVSWGACLVRPPLMGVHIFPFLFPCKWIRSFPFLEVGIFVPHVLGTWLVGCACTHIYPIGCQGKRFYINAHVFCVLCA